MLGLLSNLPKGLLGLNDPLLPNLPCLSLLLKPPKCPLCPLSKFPLNLLGWVRNGLKDFFTGLPSRSIQYKASLRWLTFSSREGSSVCLREVLTGVLKRVNGAVALGGGGGRCGGSGLWLLSIDVFEHSTKKREVIMTIKSAI